MNVSIGSVKNLTFCEISTLDHEVLYHSVKRGAFIAQVFACDFARPFFTYRIGVKYNS